MKELYWVGVCMFLTAINVTLTMMCLKIYTEMMKEHTIRRRYENQEKR